jgi:hypothetical protein
VSFQAIVNNTPLTNTYLGLFLNSGFGNYRAVTAVSTTGTMQHDRGGLHFG